MQKVIKEFKYLIEKINKNNISEHAAVCAYYTILAFVPIIILILTLTKYVGIDEEFLFIIFSESLPINLLKDAVIGIIKEVYSKSVGTITISVVFILWSAGKGFFALCNGLSSAYEVDDSNNKFIRYRLRGIVCTIIFIISIILMLLLLVFGNKINMLLQEKFHVFNKIIDIVLKSKIVISIILLSFIFSIMYKFIPKHKYKYKNQIIGAVVAAIGCNIISIFFSIYINIFTGFSLMYGSLTTIVLAMIWVYWSMYSILFGAVTNKIIAENVEKRREKIYKKTIKSIDFLN